MSEPTAQEISHDYDAQNFDLMAQLDDVIQPKKSTPTPQNQQPPKPEPVVTSNKKPELKEVDNGRARKLILEQFKEEKNLNNLRQELPVKKDDGTPRNRRTENSQPDEDVSSRKSLNTKLNRKRTEEDETRNVYEANLSMGSLSARNMLAQNLSPSNNSQMRHPAPRKE